MLPTVYSLALLSLRVVFAIKASFNGRMELRVTNGLRATSYRPLWFWRSSIGVSTKIELYRLEIA